MKLFFQMIVVISTFLPCSAMIVPRLTLPSAETTQSDIFARNLEEPTTPRSLRIENRIKIIQDLQALRAPGKEKELERFFVSQITAAWPSLTPRRRKALEPTLVNPTRCQAEYYTRMLQLAVMHELVCMQPEGPFPILPKSDSGS
jgi:hypothetical protein